MIIVFLKKPQKLKQQNKKRRHVMNSLMPSIIENIWEPVTNNGIGKMIEEFWEGAGLPTILGREEAWYPAIDLSETDNEYIVKAELPGVGKDEIEISMTDGILTIRGEKKQEKEEKKENYHFAERWYGKFSRTLGLPPDADPEKADALFDNGVLKITVPKAENARPKKIKIS